MMNLPTIERENECLFMVQDLSGLSIYEKAKAIVSFCDKETKFFEKSIDRAILEIFDRNGINVPTINKSALKQAFGLLKAKGKDIVVENCNQELFGCEIVKRTKLFTIYLEDNKLLQTCVRVKEIKL